MALSPFLDTNVVLHALKPDPFSNECNELLDALGEGSKTARLDILVLHELSYSLNRYRKQLKKSDIAATLAWLVGLPGIECDRSLFRETIIRWESTPGLSFTDAHLAARATRDGCAVLTKNVKELRRQGIAVPDPLPS